MIISIILIFVLVYLDSTQHVYSLEMTFDVVNFTPENRPFPFRNILKQQETGDIFRIDTDVNTLSVSTKFLYTFYYVSNTCDPDRAFYFYAIALDTCLQVIGKESSMKVMASNFGDIVYFYFDNKYCSGIASNTVRQQNIIEECSRFNDANIFIASFQSDSPSELVPTDTAFFTFQYYGDDNCSQQVEIEGYINGICLADDDRSIKYAFPYVINYRNTRCTGSGDRFQAPDACDTFGSYYDPYYSFPSATHYVAYLSTNTPSPTVMPTVITGTARTRQPTLSVTTPTIQPTVKPSFQKHPTRSPTSTASPTSRRVASMQPTVKSAASSSRSMPPTVAPSIAPQTYGIYFNTYQVLEGMTGAQFSSYIEQNFHVLQETVYKIIKPSRLSLGYKVYYLNRNDITGKNRLNITYQIIIANEYTLYRPSALKTCSNATNSLQIAVQTNLFNQYLSSYAASNQPNNIGGVTSNWIAFGNCQYVTPEPESSSTSTKASVPTETIFLTVGIFLIILVSIGIVISCWSAKQTMMSWIVRWIPLQSHRYLYLNPTRVAVADAEAIAIMTADNHRVGVTAVATTVSPPIAEVVSSEPLPSSRLSPFRSNHRLQPLPAAAAVATATPTAISNSVPTGTVVAQVELVNV